MKKSKDGSMDFDYTLTIDMDGFGKPSSIMVNAEPQEQDAVNSGVATALLRAQSQSNPQQSNLSY
jgi:hypothetical protein